MSKHSHISAIFDNAFQSRAGSPQMYICQCLKQLFSQRLKMTFFSLRFFFRSHKHDLDSGLIFNMADVNELASELYI